MGEADSKQDESLKCRAHGCVLSVEESGGSRSGCLLRRQHLSKDLNEVREGSQKSIAGRGHREGLEGAWSMGRDNGG